MILLVLPFCVSGVLVAMFTIGNTNIFHLVKRNTYYADEMYSSYYNNQKYNKIALNGEEVAVEYLKFQHQRTDQFGVVGYIENSKIKAGQNSLVVRKVLGENAGSEWTIPFYYISKN